VHRIPETGFVARRICAGETLNSGDRTSSGTLETKQASPDDLSHTRHIGRDMARAIPLATNPKPILNSDAFLTSFARCSTHRVRATLDARHSYRDT
jgi:hypothetical protein